MSATISLCVHSMCKLARSVCLSLVEIIEASNIWRPPSYCKSFEFVFAFIDEQMAYNLCVGSKISDIFFLQLFPSDQIFRSNLRNAGWYLTLPSVVTFIRFLLRERERKKVYTFIAWLWNDIARHWPQLIYQHGTRPRL